MNYISQRPHICVQVDFGKPLIKLVKIGGIKQPVQYEGINSLCFSCVRVGHKGESYSYMEKLLAKENVDIGEDASHVSQTQDFPAKDLFRPWVLVTRKKNDSRKLRKDTAQTFPYGLASNTRPQSPTPISSPSKIGFNHTRLVESVRTIESKSPSPVSAIVTDRTISTKESTKPNSMSARGARAKHQSRNTLEVKESHQSQNTNVSTNKTKSGKSNPLPPKQYVSILSKPLPVQRQIFTADAVMGTAQLPTPNSKPKSKSEGEPMEGINISGGGAPNPSTSKASFMNEGDTNCKLAEVQMNFSKAALRSIDPNLRKISIGLDEATHLKEDWVRPTPFEEGGTEVGNHVIDNEKPVGMQVEEGGKTPNSS